MFVLNSCARLVDEIRNTEGSEIRDYLVSEFSKLLMRPNIREEIESALLEDGREEIVLTRLKECSNG